MIWSRDIQSVLIKGCLKIQNVSPTASAINSSDIRAALSSRKKKKKRLYIFKGIRVCLCRAVCLHRQNQNGVFTISGHSNYRRCGASLQFVTTTRETSLEMPWHFCWMASLGILEGEAMAGMLLDSSKELAFSAQMIANSSNGLQHRTYGLHEDLWPGVALHL